MIIEIENDYIIPNSLGTWHNESTYLNADEEDVYDYLLLKLNYDLEDEELEEIVRCFDYYDDDFVAWLTEREERRHD